MRRREFVAVLGGAMSAWPLIASGQSSPPPSPVRQAWLDRHKETILEPELPIVDPHHHLWIRPGWRYMPDDLLADIDSGHNIVATVFVQAHSMYRASGPIEMRPVGETEFINGVAAMFASGVHGKTLACAGIVGQADLMLGSQVESVLTAHLRAGGDRFRGIRHITSWDPDPSMRNPDYPSPPGLLKDQTFREGIAKLVQLGLSFDAMVYHPQIDDVADLAGTFPDLKIVLNHAGVPLGINAYRGRRDEVFATWSASLKALARHENVCIKIGGLGQRYTGLDFSARAEPPTSMDVAQACRPYVETCIEAFGPSRSMFESNFPVDKPSYSYQVFWNACKLMTKGASRSERADLFAGTATRFYHLNGIG